LPGVAINVTELPAQKGFDDDIMDTVTSRFGLTVIRYWMLDAGLLDVHCSDEVRIHVTRSPLTGIYEYVGLFVPATVPLTFHWYDGVAPPLIGYAVNVTDVPEQTGFTSGEIVILTG
jgi:hypothetical protein